MARNSKNKKASALRGPAKKTPKQSPKPSSKVSAPKAEVQELRIGDSIRRPKRFNEYDILYHAHEPKLESLPGLKEILNEKAKDGWTPISFMRGPVTVAIVLERLQ